MFKDSIICCLQEISACFKDTHSLKVNGWKKIFMQMVSNVHTYIRQIYFKFKNVTRDNEGYKDKFQQDNIIITDTYVPKIKTLRYMQQILIKNSNVRL
jgi:hypothetical protein